jgi:hypothetical protein
MCCYTQGSFSAFEPPTSEPRDLEAALTSAIKNSNRDGASGGGVSDPPSPKGTVFRGWRDARVLQPIPGRLQPALDMSDKLFVSFTRMMRSYPMLRLAGLSYWLMLHLWLVVSLALRSHGLTQP